MIISERLAPSTSLTPTGGISNQWSAVLDGLFRALNKHKNYTVDLVTRVDNVSIDRNEAAHSLRPGLKETQTVHGQQPAALTSTTPCLVSSPPSTQKTTRREEQPAEVVINRFGRRIVRPRRFQDAWVRVSCVFSVSNTTHKHTHTRPDTPVPRSPAFWPFITIGPFLKGLFCSEHSNRFLSPLLGYVSFAPVSFFATAPPYQKSYLIAALHFADFWVSCVFLECWHFLTPHASPHKHLTAKHTRIKNLVCNCNSHVLNKTDNLIERELESSSLQVWMQPCYLDRAPSISSVTMTSTKVDRSQLQLKVTHKAPAAGFATCSQEKCSQTVLWNFPLPVRIHVLCHFSSKLLRFFSTMRPKFFRIFDRIGGGWL